MEFNEIQARSLAVATKAASEYPIPSLRVNPFQIEAAGVTLASKGFDLPSGTINVFSSPSSAPGLEFLQLLGGLIPVLEQRLRPTGRGLAPERVDLVSMLSGAVLLYGDDILGLPARQRARDIAVIFENPEWGFLCSTVEEDFIFSFLACGAVPPPLYALRRYGLFEARGQSPEQLSGGEQQRLSCAPVMERKPKVIIGDFSSSNLDEDFRMDTLRSWIDSGSASGQTFILRGIDPDELPRCDNVLAVEDNVLTMHPGSLVRNFVPDPSEIADEVVVELGSRRQASVNQPVVTAHDVKTVHAKGAVTARIHLDEVVLLVGPNGSGTTSFGRAVIERPSVSGLYIEPTASISMALQNPEHMLFSRSVAAELGGNAVLLALCGLAAEGKMQPLSLSRSKQKLVSIASACRLGADLVILDEPTVGLDPADFKTLGRLMRHFAGRAFLIISHDPILHQVGRRMGWTVCRIGSDQ